MGSSAPSQRADPVGDFATFFACRFEPCARLALLLTGDEHLAEELAQEALTRVQPRFAELDDPDAYTRVVVVNLVRKHFRREARRNSAEKRTLTPVVVAPEHRELLDVVAALPLRQRSVIVLRYYEGLSEAEIAAALGCRQGTVKSLAARALERLRREVGDR